MNLRVNTPTNFFQSSKQNLEKIGLSGILIFNDSGLPIYLRDFSNSKGESSSNSHDDLVFSAFISSLSNFIKIYDTADGYLKGFSTATNRFFIKNDEDLIYCLVLNSNIFYLSTGENLINILEKTLQELIKSFTVYYKMTRTKDFIEKNFLDVFENQIDSLLLVNLRKAQKNAIISNNSKNDFYQKNSEEFFSETFNHAFLKHGILGLIIFDPENNPVIIRDYVINQKYVKQTEYYQRIVLTLKQFNHFSLGPIQDIGIDDTRLFLRIEKDFTICLIISEINYWKHDPGSLSKYLDELLKNLPLEQHLKYTINVKNNSIQQGMTHLTNYQIDQLLFENLQSIIQSSPE